MTATSDQFIAWVQSELGKPYVYGDEGPNDFDCSGLVQYTLGKVGIKAPRTAAEQQQWTTSVTAPLPGDLVFFGHPAYHVGIYIGGGKMIAAPHPGAVVRVSTISAPYNYGRIKGLTLTGQAIQTVSAATTAAATTVTAAFGLSNFTGDLQQVVYEGLFGILGLALVGYGVYKLAAPSAKKALSMASPIGDIL